MTPSDMKQQYMRLIDRGFNRGDTAVVHEVISPSYEAFDPQMPRERGPSSVIRTIEELRNAFAGCRYDVVSLVAEGDMLASRWYISGRHVAPFRGHPPVDGQRTFRVLGMSFNRFENGFITEGHITWDVKGLFLQLELPAHAAL